MQSYGIYSFYGTRGCSRSKGCYFNDIYLFVNIFPRSFPSLDVRQKKLTCGGSISIHPPLGNSGVALIEQCDSEAGFLKQIDNRAHERTLRTFLARKQERESAHHEINRLLRRQFPHIGNEIFRLSVAECRERNRDSCLAACKCQACASHADIDRENIHHFFAPATNRAMRAFLRAAVLGWIMRFFTAVSMRSEERRVGKERRSRWAPYP